MKKNEEEKEKRKQKKLRKDSKQGAVGISSMSSEELLRLDEVRILLRREGRGPHFSVCCLLVSYLDGFFAKSKVSVTQFSCFHLLLYQLLHVNAVIVNKSNALLGSLKLSYHNLKLEFVTSCI